MDVADKIAVGRSAGRRDDADSIVQPTGQPGCADSSSSLAASHGLRPPQTDAKVALVGRTKVADVDRQRVAKAAAWISARVASTPKKRAVEVGEYVLRTFFAGDPDLLRLRNPQRDASYRVLAEKCGSPELPVSKTWLNNALGIAVMIRHLPESARAFRTLPPSYQERLLPLRDPEWVEDVARQAVIRGLSCRELRVAVAKQLAKATKENTGFASSVLRRHSGGSRTREGPYPSGAEMHPSIELGSASDWVARTVAHEFSLSHRETEILVAATRGMSTKEAACDLRISRKTAEYFWTRIFRKVHCLSQLEVMALLLRYACAQGSLPPYERADLSLQHRSSTK